jgi:hypothetical protein
VHGFELRFVAFGVGQHRADAQRSRSSHKHFESRTLLIPPPLAVSV